MTDVYERSAEVEVHTRSPSGVRSLPAEVPVEIEKER